MARRGSRKGDHSPKAADYGSEGSLADSDEPHREAPAFQHALKPSHVAHGHDRLNDILLKKRRHLGSVSAASFTSSPGGQRPNNIASRSSLTTPAASLPPSRRGSRQSAVSTLASDAASSPSSSSRAGSEARACASASVEPVANLLNVAACKAALTEAPEPLPNVQRSSVGVWSVHSKAPGRASLGLHPPCPSDSRRQSRQLYSPCDSRRQSQEIHSPCDSRRQSQQVNNGSNPRRQSHDKSNLLISAGSASSEESVRRWSTTSARRTSGGPINHRPRFLQPLEQSNARRSVSSQNLQDVVPSVQTIDADVKLDTSQVASSSDLPNTSGEEGKLGKEGKSGEASPKASGGFGELLSRHFEKKAKKEETVRRRASFRRNSTMKMPKHIRHRPGTPVGFKQGSYAACILEQEDADSSFGETDSEEDEENPSELVVTTGGGMKGRRYSQQMKTAVKKVSLLLNMVSAKADRCLSLGFATGMDRHESGPGFMGG